MKVFILALVTLIAISSSNAQGIWSACPRVSPPSSVTVTSPECTPICTIARGESLEAKVVFTSAAAHTTLTSRFVANFSGFEIVLEESDACPQIIGGCPTTANVETTWDINLLIDESTPQITGVPVRGELYKVGIGY